MIVPCLPCVCLLIKRVSLLKNTFQCQCWRFRTANWEKSAAPQLPGVHETSGHKKGRTKLTFRSPDNFHLLYITI